jgi:hypothetical protein
MLVNFVFRFLRGASEFVPSDFGCAGDGQESQETGRRPAELRQEGPRVCGGSARAARRGIRDHRGRQFSIWTPRRWQPEALASRFAASSDLASQIASPRDFAGNRWLQCPVSPSRACYFQLHSGGCLLTWGRGAFKLQTRTVPLVAGAKRSSSDAVAPVPSPCSPRARRIRRHRAL